VGLHLHADGDHHEPRRREGRDRTGRRIAAARGLRRDGALVPTVVRNHVAKTSISIDDADLRWLRQRARRLHAGNLSAAVSEGIRLLRHKEAMGALLDRLGAPELSAAELGAAWAELDGRAPSRPKRRGRAA